MCADYKYCALARLPSDGRAAPRRQSYNYEYCALARLPPDDRATIKTNTAHARLPPDDRAAPRRPGLLHCAHTKGAMHQIIISSNLRRDTLQAQGWHSGVVADGVQLPGVPASADGARHGRPRGRCSGPPKSDSCDHCPGPPTREIGAFSPVRKRASACVLDLVEAFQPGRYDLDVFAMLGCHDSRHPVRHADRVMQEVVLMARQRRG